MAYCTKCGAQVEGDFCTQCGTPAGQVKAPAGSSPAYSPGGGATSAPPVPPTRKRGPLFWVLIGCGGLILIGGLVVVLSGVFFWRMARQAGVDPELMQKNPSLAVAKMLAATNPDIEVVSVDEDRGIIRVHDKKTGKTLMMNLADAKQGKITFEEEGGGKLEIQAQGEGDKASLEFKGPEGSMKMGAGAGKLPGWLPAYANAEQAGTFEVKSGEGEGGSFTFQTRDNVEKVIAFYEEELKGAGFEVQRTLTQAQAREAIIMLAAEDAASGRSATITAAGKEGAATVNVIFKTGK